MRQRLEGAAAWALLIFVVLFFLAVPYAFGQAVSERGLENRDFKARIRVVSADPDGNACTLTTPPALQAYDNSGTLEFFCCSASTWSQCDPAGLGGGGDVTGPASSTDNCFARFDGTTGKILQNTTACLIGADNGDVTAYNDVHIQATQPALKLIESDNADENISINVNAGSLRIDERTDADAFVELKARIDADAPSASLTIDSGGDVQVPNGSLDMATNGVGGEGIVFSPDVGNWTGETAITMDAFGNLAQTEASAGAPTASASGGRRQSLINYDKLMQLQLGKAGFTIRFDDGHTDNYDDAAGLLEEYGMRGSFGVNVNTLDTGNNMTTAEVVELYNRGHEICSHDADHDYWSGASHVDVETLVGNIADDVSWFQTNLGFDAPPCFFVPYSQWTQIETAGCENSRDSERLAAPCRQPLAAMAYPNAHTAGSQAFVMGPHASKYEQRATDFPVQAFTGTQYAQQIKDALGMGMNGGQWVTFGFHDITGAGEIGVTEFENFLIELKTFVDTGRAVNISMQEAQAHMYQGQRHNKVANPSLNYKDPHDGSNLTVPGWTNANGVTDKDDCTTNDGSGWVCYKEDPDWPERNIGQTDNASITFEIEDLIPGREYVAAVLVRFPVGTQGNGSSIIITNYGGGDRKDADEDARYWMDQQVEPGNGTDAGSWGIAHWDDNEWGLVWIKFMAEQVVTYALINTSLGTGCTASYGSETDCYWDFKWPVVYEVGVQGNAGASDPSELARAPFASNRFFRTGTGQVVSGASSACVELGDIWDATNQQHLHRHPTKFWINRFELDTTAGTTDLRYEFYGDSSCASMVYYEFPEDIHSATSCTSDPCTTFPGVYVSNDSGRFSNNMAYPSASESNMFWVKIYNDDVSSVTVDWEVDGIVYD